MNKTTGQGELVAIFIAAKAGSPTTAVATARLVAGRGIEGDRYFAAAGTFSNGTRKSEVTLIEEETLMALERDYQINLPAGATRRNLVVRGVPLNHLVNRRFRLGGAELEGERLCNPCTYLEGLTQAGVKAALTHRGGLRARIIKGGAVQAGDPVSWGA